MCALETPYEKIIDYNPELVRAEFPIFQYKPNKDLIYFDNAATTQKPRSVIDAVSNYYEQFNSNTHRGAYKIAEQATHAYESARKKVGRYINAASDREIVFVRGATEAINFAATGWGMKFINAGDEIIISELEHHSNIVPWQIVAEKKSAKLK